MTLEQTSVPVSVCHPLWSQYFVSSKCSLAHSLSHAGPALNNPTIPLENIRASLSAVAEKSTEL